MPESKGSARGWKVASPLMAALCGLLLLISNKTAGGTDLRASDLLEMPDLVRAEERRVQQLSGQAEELVEEVDNLTASRGDDETRRIQTEIEAALPAAGMTAVEGRGLTVTMDDAPRHARQELAPGTHIEDYIVHQQDLEAVMNALWAGGAEAMMVMDQRIGATSTVRCVGSVLLLEGRQYSPPYTIAAIGDPEALQAALDDSPGVGWFRSAADALGLGYEVAPGESIEMPAYESGRAGASS
jgi:uncharacterized protein YlxW (UPF0749 family)